MSWEFFMNLQVVLVASHSITWYYDNNGEVSNSKELRSYKRAKHIKSKYHLLREIVGQGEAIVYKISFRDNLADPFMKALLVKNVEIIEGGHLVGLRMQRP